jgi:hypothetical protein
MEDVGIQAEPEWQILFQQTALYAAGRLNRLRWRATYQGILPDGFDAESIASEALLELLKQLENRQRSQRSQIALRRELERLVRKVVNRLHHRKENRLLRNEPDLPPLWDMDGDPVSPLDLIETPAANPATTLLDQEAVIAGQDRQLRFALFLSDERRLSRLFQLTTAGIWQPKMLASKLKLSRRAIENLQKRLHRRWLKFSEA